MKKILFLLVCVLFTQTIFGQVGSVEAEKYQADFEKRKSISPTIRSAISQ